MPSYAYYNGNFDLKEKISIPLSDRAIFFGDAIYDAAIGSYDRILWEEEHLNRFFYNAERLKIKHTYSKEKLSDLLHEIGVKSGFETYFIYFQLSRDYESRKHSFLDCSSNLLVTIEKIDISINKPRLKLMTRPDLRYQFCDIKTVNLLPTVIASTEAEILGYDEPVFVKNNFVTECAKSNISIINRGRLITHPKTWHILPGIARHHLIKNCFDLGIEVEERRFTCSEMMDAEEIIVSSTTKLCRAVENIDGRVVGGCNKKLVSLLCQKMFDEFNTFCLR